MKKQPDHGVAYTLPLSANTDDRTTHVAIAKAVKHKFFCRQTNEESNHDDGAGGTIKSAVSYWIVPCHLYGRCYNGCSLWQGGFDFVPIESWNKAAPVASVEKAVAPEDIALHPHWPDGLEQLKFYEFPCDDKGRNGGSWLRVFVAGDGDVHVSMQDWEDINEAGTAPSPFPSVRCRTLAGGGRYRRTRQALLWLAQAVRLDSEELTTQHKKERKQRHDSTQS